MAHITDIHIQPETFAPQGTAACLRHINALKDKPDLILTGGDLIMDSFAATRERTQIQWDLFKRTFAENNSIPVRHCIGNHDIWGWNLARSKATGNEPDYGKKWAVETLGLDRAYYSFDQAGWHFVVLDSVQPVGDNKTYFGRLDDRQFEWLRRDLEATPKDRPVLIISHIPIVSMCAFFGASKDDIVKDHKTPVSDLLADMPRVRALLQKFPNVSLALSGHIHLVDRVDYEGVSYLCGGAVCGAWWMGNNMECVPGYNLIDLYTDGTFDRQYVPWGWKPGK